MLALASAGLAFEDFRASSQQEIDVCECASETVPIKVTNTGYLKESKISLNGGTEQESEITDIISRYRISFGGEASQFFSISSPRFELSSDETRTVFGHVNAPCGSAGSYDLYIDIESGSIKKRISQQVNIRKCANLKLWMPDNDKTIDPCQSADYRIKIKNTGEFQETYNLETDRLEGWISFSDNPVTVSPGRTRTVVMKIRPQCGYDNAETGIILNARAMKSNSYSELPIVLRINQSYYDFDIELYDKEYELCLGTDISVPVKITNHADTENLIQLRLKDGDLDDISYSKVVLEPSSENIIYVKPEIESDGRQRFTVYGKSEKQDIRKTADFVLYVDTCHGVKFDADKIYLGTGNQSASIDVFHLATMPQNYSLALTAPSFIMLQQQEIELDPKEWTLVHLASNASDPGRYQAVISAYYNDDIVYSEQFDIIVADSQAERAWYAYMNLIIIGIIDIVIILIAIIAVLAVRSKRKKKKEQKTLKEIEEKPVKKEEPTESKPYGWLKILGLIILILIILAFIGATIYYSYNFLSGRNETAINITNESMINASNMSGAVNQTMNLSEENVTANITPQENFTETNATLNDTNASAEGNVSQEPGFMDEVSNLSDSIIDTLSRVQIGKSISNFFYTLFLYKWYILSLIVLAIAILLIISFRRTMKEREEPEIIDEDWEQKVDEAVKEEKLEEMEKPQYGKWLTAFGAILLLLVIALIGYYYTAGPGGLNATGNETVDIDEFDNASEDYDTNITPEEELPDDDIHKTEEPEEIPAEDNVTDIIDQEQPEELEEEIIMPEEEGPTEAEIAELEGPVLRWDKNTNLTVDLNKLFTDPDNDLLMFSASEADNVNVSIDLGTGVATLIPEQNFTGISSVWFIADDGRGGVTVSDKINLVVTEPEEKTPMDRAKENIISALAMIWGFIMEYIYYIIVGFIILIIIILITRYNEHLIVFLDEEEKEKTDKKNKGAKKKNNSAKKKPKKKSAKSKK